MKRAITLLLIFLSCIHALTAQVPSNGEVDLSAVDFSATDPLRLDGEWHFYYGDVLTLNQIDSLSKLEATALIKVPSVWKGTVDQNGQALTGTGIATYWLRLKLPKTKQLLALKLQDIASSYQLIIDQDTLTQVGILGDTKATTVPGSRPQIIALPTNKQDITLIIHVANFHYRVGGLWESISIGKEDQLVARRYQTTVRNVLIAGMAFAFLCYHLGLYYLRRTSYSSLYFALLCLVVMVRLFVIEDMIVLELFPDFSWEWRMSLDVFTFYMCVPTALLFTRSIFPAELPKKMIIVVLVLGFIASILCLLTPALVYSSIIPIYRYFAVIIFLFMVYAMIKAVQHHRRGAVTYLIGYVIFIALAINDILYAANVIQSVVVVSYALMILLIAKVLVLAKQFVLAFDQAELLTEELQDVNQNLEQKVIERTVEINQKNKDLANKNDKLLVSEEELRQSTAELQEINENLQAATIEIEKMWHQEHINIEQLKAAQVQLIQSEKMASLGQMTAGIAHEINNPINFILGGTQGLKLALDDLLTILATYDQIKEIEPDQLKTKVKEIVMLEEELVLNEVKEEVGGLIQNIELGASRTATIVRGLRTFSRMDDEDKVLVDVHEEIDAALIILKNKYKHRIELKLNYAPDLPEIYCHPSQLNQVFMNLIANAIDAIEEEGVIEIHSLNHQDDIEIQVRDSGTGIPEEVQNKIFDPFFTTKEIGKGTGLGLSISYGIIENHKGCLKVESKLGEGTTFRVILPKGE